MLSNSTSLQLTDFNNSEIFDCIIVGGGAAGLMCALQAGKRGKKVLLVDAAQNAGERIRISGGGRCNVTHACFDIAEMSKKYPRGASFVKKAVS